MLMIYAIWDNKVGVPVTIKTSLIGGNFMQIESESSRVFCIVSRINSIGFAIILTLYKHVAT